MTIAHDRTHAEHGLGHRVPGTHHLADYIAFVQHEGERFADVVETASLDADIVPCPGWSMRDLIRHLGEIHLWAAANVAAPRRRWLYVADLGDLAPYWPELAARAPRDDELVSWYRATHRNLIDVLESAPLDVPALCFLPAPSPLVMWARRQASEIAVHRFDAEQAQSITSHYDRDFAADMLDELIIGLAPLAGGGADSERVLLVHAEDVDMRWWLTIGPNGIRTSRDARPKEDLTVAGTAADLYLLLWNRTREGTVQLHGDVDVLEHWHRACRVEWRH